MRPNTSAVSLVFVLIAASSLVSMISTFKIDQIVHGDLYNYGLHFSYQWAMPYWTMTTIVFGMGWFNLIIAVTFQFYVLIYGRKEALQPEATKEPQPQPAKEEIIEVETKPTEKVEESKEQVAEPAEKVEKKPEETQPVVEATPQPEQTETIQAGEAEGQKEQESKPAEESKTETKETSTTTTETKQETSEKSEETPILIGVPHEEPQTAAENTPQQV